MKTKRISSLLLAALLMTALVSCSGKDGLDGGAADTATPTTAATEDALSDTMDLSRYIRALSRFFYEPCEAIDSEGLQEDVLCLLFSFSEAYGESLGFARWDEAEESLLIIEGEGLRRVGKLLLGEGFCAEDYHDVLHHGCYLEESDTYEVSFGTDYWGGASVEIPHGTEPRITETANGAAIEVGLQFYDPNDVGGEDEESAIEPETVFLRYLLESIESDGFRYYRLIRVEALSS